MTHSGTGGVFFLGTRAHYQVLEPPDTISYDLENGNASNEIIYQNPSHIQEIWSDDNLNPQTKVIENSNYVNNERGSWMSEVTLLDCKSQNFDDFEFNTGVTRRLKKNRQRDGSNEQILNNYEDVYDLNAAALNMCDRGSPKTHRSRRCMNLRALIANLKTKRKRRLSVEELGYIENLENAISMCSFKDSCRCLDCQSRYFDCDDTDTDYSDSDDRSLPSFPTNTLQNSTPSDCEDDDCSDDDDEVFINTPPSDATSTDLLIEEKQKNMSVSSDCTDSVELDEMQLEMAAGTPVVLDYLLHHPFTCVLQ